MIPNDKEGHKLRFLAMQPVFFVLAQTFTVTTTWRDRTLFKEFNIHRPTEAYRNQSLFFFAVATFFAAHCFGNMDWMGFYATSLGWIFVSAANLSKLLRDRNYADIFERIPPQTMHECFMELSEICKGSLEFQAFSWGSTAVAVVQPFVVILFWKTHTIYKVIYKPCLMGFIAYTVRDSFYLAKLFRDIIHPARRKELTPQFQFFTGLSWISSIGVYVAIVLWFKVQPWVRFYLIIGWAWAMCSTFFLTKHIRDRRDIVALIERVESAVEDSESPPLKALGYKDATHEIHVDVPPQAPVLSDPHSSDLGRGPGVLLTDRTKSLYSKELNGYTPPRGSKIKGHDTSLPPIRGLVAPTEQRGEAAKLMLRAQNSLLNDQGHVSNAKPVF
jgi:hypothetical protein